MKREQFLRELHKEARKSGKSFKVNTARGKGGHCIVHLDDRFSVVKSGEISPLMAKVIRKQLGLE